MHIPITVSAKQMNELLEEHPILGKHKAARQYVCWLKTGRLRYDEETGNIMVPHQLLTHFMDAKIGNVRTADLLEFVRDNVFPAHAWSDYWVQGKKCRAIKNTGIPEEFLHEWVYKPIEDRVLARTKREYTEWKQQETIRSLRKDATAQTFPYKDQQFIADYLHNLPLDLFSIKPENMEKAYEAARQRNDMGQSLRALHATGTMPGEFYRLSKKGNSTRLFGMNQQFLASDIRHITHPDWIDIDLVNCQLAILAGRYHAPKITALLKEEQAIWPLLARHMNVPLEQGKPALKKGVYSSIFGMKPCHVELMIEHLFKQKGLEKTIPFLAHPLMQELLIVLEKAKATIKKNHGAMGAYGWMDYYPHTDINQFLAWNIQTYELALITPVYELACKANKAPNEEYMVMLHQHDGVSILPGIHATYETLIVLIKQAVKAKGHELDIPISIG